MKEFQELHDGHFPNHLADSWPQFWQKKSVFVLAKVTSIECNKMKKLTTSEETGLSFEIESNFCLNFEIFNR